MRLPIGTSYAHNAKENTHQELMQKKCLQKQSESKDAKYHTQSQYIKSDKVASQLNIKLASETFFLIPL